MKNEVRQRCARVGHTVSLIAAPTYSHSLVTQIALRPLAPLHAVNSRLARWLLMTRDRSAQTNFATQAFISNAGIRREGVNKAAGALQKII